MAVSTGDVVSFLCNAVAAAAGGGNSVNVTSSSSSSLSSNTTADCNVTVSSFLLSSSSSDGGGSAADQYGGDLAMALSMWGASLTETAARSAVFASSVATAVVLVAALWFAFRYLLPSTSASSTTATEEQKVKQLANIVARLEEVEDLLTQQQQEVAQHCNDVASLRRQVAQLSEEVQLVEEERKELQVQLNYRGSDPAPLSAAPAEIYHHQLITSSPSAQKQQHQNTPQRRSNVIEGVAMTTTPVAGGTSTPTSVYRSAGSTSDLVHSPPSHSPLSSHRTFVVSSSPHRR